MMKGFLLLLSTIVGIASILVFRDHILDTATTVYYSFSNGTTNLNSQAKDQPPAPAQQIHTATTNMSVPRAVRKAFLAVEQAEGAGARVRRSIGTPQLRNFSPFLMLDHFSVKPGAGFPDHPHRGQEVSHNRPPPQQNPPRPFPFFHTTSKSTLY